LAVEYKKSFRYHLLFSLNRHELVGALKNLYPFIALSDRFGPSKTRGVRKPRVISKRVIRLGSQIAQTVHKYQVNNTK
jgi:hypothetical protein